jgi:hypothetical protein
MERERRRCSLAEQESHRAIEAFRLVPGVPLASNHAAFRR